MTLSILRTFLAEKPQGFLDRAVGIAEEYGFFIGFVEDRTPRGNDKDILFRPIEIRTANAAAATSFYHGINCPVGRTIGAAAEARRQELHERSNGRHWISAGDGIDVLHLDAVPGVHRTVTIKLIQCLPRPGVRIIENRTREALDQLYRNGPVDAW